MATITNIFGIRQLRAEPTAHILRFKGGKLVQNGRGLNFRFRPYNTGLAEVPIGDQEIPFLCHAHTNDFQQITAQGVVTYRAANPVALAERIDFTIDNARGTWTRKPFDQLAGLITQLVQQILLDHCARRTLEATLTEGVAPLRSQIQTQFAEEQTIIDLGLEIAIVRLTALTPTAEVEKALQKTTREQIQQHADEATFTRRAAAVDKERAIAENELKNQIELAAQEHELLEKQGRNAREQAEQETVVAMINAETEDKQAAMRAQRKATDIEMIERAEVNAYELRTNVDAGLGRDVLFARALMEVAANIGNIKTLNVTPDLLTNLVNALEAGTADAGQ